jgi:predicted phosphodiesterase
LVAGDAGRCYIAEKESGSDEKMERRIPVLVVVAISVFLILAGCTSDISYNTRPFELPSGAIQVSFSVTADMRDYTGDDMLYFRGVCERVAYGGPGDFMVSPGDIDPPVLVYLDIQTYIDPSYPWYPVVGNHEAETPSDMDWLRAFSPNGNALPNIVNSGPENGVETSYSFDYGEAHFTVINEYYDGESDTGTDGDVADPLHAWLVHDLSATTKTIKFVIGHEPAYPQPDEESGRLRHQDDSLNAHQANRDRFWQTLADNEVTAYVCGHTHNFSAYQDSGVWQIDAGHARGFADTGARSTFVMFYVMDDGSVWCYPYRLNWESHNYELRTPRKIRQP